MKENRRILTVMTMLFSLIINCLILTDRAAGQNRSAGGRKSEKAKSSKAAGKKERSKKDKKERDEDREEKERVVRLNRNNQETSGPFSQTATAFGITPPIRDMPAVRDGQPPFQGEIEIKDEENNEATLDRVDRTVTPDRDELAERSRAAARANAPTAMPGPALSFNGILSTEVAAAFGTTSMPPDTVGDVGPNHYVQATNIGVFRVFNKTTGAPLTALAKISTLFTGLPAGNPCRTIDDGDPIVNYDPMADRWLVSQFQVSQSPNGQCIAVSQTGDPTGAWYAYFFPQPNTNFPDYPHWGVWTDGYYLATHDFNAAGTAYVEGSFWAYDRVKMLAGDPTASYIKFGRATSFGHLPADVDGYMPPPAGSPEVFLEIDATEYGAATDRILVYEFVPDFATPANSTFTATPQTVDTAPFDPLEPSGRTDIEQPAPATAAHNLDSLGGQLLFRVGYRNLGTIASPINSYVSNLAVNVSGVVLAAGVLPTAAQYQAGIRWTELRRAAGGTMTIFDQGTHAPDPASGTGRNRWMGSVAQDYLGNLALGFSRSGLGATDFPDIVWAGRTGGIAAAGTLNEGEATMHASTGVQSATNSRWGDYSAMTVDPTDDCTFWFTNEWRDAANNSSAGNAPFFWSTRVGNFKFPGCTSQPKGQISANVTFCSTGQPVNNARVTAQAGNFFRSTNAAGNLVSNIIAAPGSYTVSAAKPGFTLQSTVPANVVNGSVTPVSLCLNGSQVTSSAYSITNESCAVNSAADPGETLTVNLGLQVEGNSTSNLTATLQTTGGVIAASPTQSYGALAAGTPASRSFTFTVDPNAVPGSTITLTLTLADGATNLGTATYTIPVGAGAPGAAQNFNYSGAVAAIPDGNATGVNTTVNVSGVTGGISDLNFAITGTAATPAASTGLDHTWIGDLTVKLTSPAGTTVTLIELINSTTGSNGNCSSNNIFNTILDDSAATSVDSACPGSASTSGPLTGTFKPQNPLSAFNGQNPNGTWTLNVSDAATPDSGSVRAYRLTIAPSTAACNTAKVWTGATSSDWHTASNWNPSGVPAAGASVVIPATGVTNNPTISTSDVSLANLTVVSPRVLTISAARTLNVTGATLINGALTVTGTATLNPSGAGLSSSNVTFNGTTTQTIPALSYNNLTINNATGVLLGGNTNVGGTLALTNGVVDAGANTLTLANCAPAALTGGSATSYVKGSVNRCAATTGNYIYPVGTTNGYSPVAANITALGVNPSGLTIRANQGNKPGMDAAQSLQRYWTLTEAGDLTTDLTFNYLDPTDIAGTESNYKLFRFDGSGGTAVTPFTLNTGANTISTTGVTTFSDWAVGNLAPTAAAVSVSGRVVAANGRGIAGATVNFTNQRGEVFSARTNQFGNYTLNEMRAGETYVVSVSSKRFRFATQILNLNEDSTNVNFTAAP